jgi:hypothetical protein
MLVTLLDTLNIRSSIVITLLFSFAYIVFDLFNTIVSSEYLRDIQRIDHPNEEPNKIFLFGLILSISGNIIMVLYMFLLDKLKEYSKASAILICLGVVISLLFNLYFVMIFGSIEDELVYSVYILTIERLSLILKLIVLIVSVVLYRKNKQKVHLSYNK